jgi:hypothetical protein
LAITATSIVLSSSLNVCDVALQKGQALAEPFIITSATHRATPTTRIIRFIDRPSSMLSHTLPPARIPEDNFCYFDSRRRGPSLPLVAPDNLLRWINRPSDAVGAKFYRHEVAGCKHPDYRLFHRFPFPRYQSASGWALFGV